MSTTKQMPEGLTDEHLEAAAIEVVKAAWSRASMVDGVALLLEYLKMWRARGGIAFLADPLPAASPSPNQRILDATALARMAHPDWGVYGLNGYAAAIREHSQPLVDELATVKAERDEMREAVVEANAAVMNLETKLRVFEQMLADNPGRYDVRPSMADLSSMIVDAMDARAILAKHPKP